jgi:hypothetical protein
VTGDVGGKDVGSWDVGSWDVVTEDVVTEHQRLVPQGMSGQHGDGASGFAGGIGGQVGQPLQTGPDLPERLPSRLPLPGGEPGAHHPQPVRQSFEPLNGLLVAGRGHRFAAAPAAATRAANSERSSETSGCH